MRRPIVVREPPCAPREGFLSPMAAVEADGVEEGVMRDVMRGMVLVGVVEGVAKVPELP